jgi:CubicO group peptidase (beta-lactamase class C family)
MRTSIRFAFFGLLLAAWVPALAAPVGIETAAKTAGGTALRAPAGWDMQARSDATILTAPEGDFRIAVIDVGKAADVKDALAIAWQRYRPDAKRTIKLITARAAKDGWSERQIAEYETSPNERAVIDADARRVGNAWTVIIYDGSEATAGKRGAALVLVQDSLRPAGFVRETFAGKRANALTPARIALLKDFITQSSAQLGIPGVGFALIEKGDVLFEGGLGVKELGKADPVDAHTLFMIASNTKGMSTLLLSRLVDAGKLQWDQPVTQVYPAFRLGSDATTAKVLVRHLVCACTGLPRKDTEWLLNTPRDTPASATFTQLAATEPTSGFGEVFQYNNLMAAAAGYVGGHIVHPDMELGAAYDAAMQALIFDPLGMKDTVFPIDAALTRNHASPHGDDMFAKPAVMPMDFNYTVMPYRPAGAAWSSAHDMIRYVSLELTQGVLPNGKRLLSARNLLARRAHNVTTGEDEYYGMGLEDNRKWGISVIHHGGSMFGYKSDWVAIPGAQVGAVVLTNSENGYALTGAFARRLVEILYDGKPEAAAMIAATAARREPEAAKFRERLVVPPAPAAMAGIGKTFDNPQLGRLDVRRAGNDVVFATASGSSRMASRKNDDGTTSFVAIDPTLLGWEYVAGTQAGKTTLTTRDDQHSYIFLPIAD